MYISNDSLFSEDIYILKMEGEASPSNQGGSSGGPPNGGGGNPGPSDRSFIHSSNSSDKESPWDKLFKRSTNNEFNSRYIDTDLTKAIRFLEMQEQLNNLKTKNIELNSAIKILDGNPIERTDKDLEFLIQQEAALGADLDSNKSLSDNFKDMHSKNESLVKKIEVLIKKNRTVLTQEIMWGFREYIGKNPSVIPAPIDFSTNPEYVGNEDLLTKANQLISSNPLGRAYELSHEQNMRIIEENNKINMLIAERDMHLKKVNEYIYATKVLNNLENNMYVDQSDKDFLTKQISGIGDAHNSELTMRNILWNMIKYERNSMNNLDTKITNCKDDLIIKIFYNKI